MEAEKYDANSPIAPFVIQTNAAGVEYISSTVGDLIAPTEASNTGQAWYTFKATAATISLNATVNLPTADNDSFHYQIAGLAPWATKNGTQTAGFEEISLGDFNNAVVGQTYVLKIQRREAGAQLDKFRLVGGNFAQGTTPPPDPTTDPANFMGCAVPGYPICEDFEGVAPLGAGSPWRVLTANGYIVEVTSTKSHSGGHSLHVQAKGAGKGYIEENKIPNTPGANYWIRAYIYLDAGDTVHEAFVVADTQLNQGGEQLRLHANNGRGEVMVDRRSDDAYTVRHDPLPKRSWNCWEWHQTPTEIHTYMNGKELTDLVAKYNQPNLVGLGFGYERFVGGDLGGQIWFDDIVVNTARIGCN